MTLLLPRSVLLPELGRPENQGARQVARVRVRKRQWGGVGGAHSSHGHHFRAPTSATNAFPEAQHMDNPKRRTGRCAHGHQLKYHIPTIGMYHRRELKGIQPWGVLKQRFSRIPEGQCDKLLRYHPTHDDKFPRCCVCEGGYIMALCLPIVSCMAGSGVGISTNAEDESI